LSSRAQPRSRVALTAGFGALLALMITVTLAGLFHLYRVHQQMEDIVYAQNNRAGLVAGMLAAGRARMRALDTLAFGAEDARAAATAEFRGLIGKFLAGFEALEQDRSVLAPEAIALATVRTAWDATDRAGESLVLAVHHQEPRARLEARMSEARVANETFETAVHELLIAYRMGALASMGSASGGMRQALLWVAVLGVVVLVAGALVAVEVIRRTGQAEEALAREKERAEVTLHSIGDGVITADADGRVETLNPVAERYTGWTLEAARGQPLAAVYRVVDDATGEPVPLDRPTGAAALATAMRLMDKHGKGHAIRESHAPISDLHGNAAGQVFVFHDVSQIQQMAQQLSWQASHDALTGLANRREFERRLAAMLETARSDERQHALLYMDLDNFKAVNDTCGHAAGDELLRQLTTVMSAKVRGSDTLARLGGDEFGVLLESCPLDQAQRVANLLRESIRDFRFVWQNRTFGVGVSIGLVPLGPDSADVQRVLATADTFCYEAKNRGRDCVQVYHGPSASDSGEQGEVGMLSQINAAFELGNFRLFRQQIVDLAVVNDNAVRYEVLTRMVDRRGNLIPPTGFMPAAERYNLMSSIERWVVSTLVETLHRQCQIGAIPRHPTAEEIFYAVNLSGASINDASFPDFVRKLLTRFELPRGLLCFEVTETTAISNLTKAAELMRDLKGLGCRFALDDFGIGLSSFAYLKYLPVDYVKIDGVFVRDMAADPMDHAIVEAINRIGHILGVKIVAESIENADTFERLRAMGVDYGQGYFIGEPEALAAEPAGVPLRAASA
jgi:diguanylate cyclase (GGDEF)-like protein/PAS domain S-box-containing protein